MPITFLFLMARSQNASKPLYSNQEFALYADSVVQKNVTAKALSATEIHSNYRSPATAVPGPQIAFKFSLNGRDNELKGGTFHRFTCPDQNGACETPVIKFGEPFTDNRAVPDNTYLKPNTVFKARVDLRSVLQAFSKNGYYTAFNGDKIYKQDFKGLFIAGRPAPLTTDFDNLAGRNDLKLSDADGDGIYDIALTLNKPAKEQPIAPVWKLGKGVSGFPQYASPYLLSDAVYNLALEEMINAVEKDSTFRTGKEWAGVWTRDISYSIILSMAYLQPQVAKNSLLRKVNKRRRIIQDTGTGGAWPCSTDRMIWAVAAWELYTATGNEDWLRQAYAIIKNSLEDDYNVAYDKATGLVKGESSFLDWREQTYPRWMQPVDIYESECLGTNAVHYRANTVLATMATLLGKPQEAEKYNGIADRIKAGINNLLWLPDKGYYAQFLYGRAAKIASPRSETLGEALCVLFDIADAAKQKALLQNLPVMAFGVPCIYPQIPGIPPYHNNAVWPFVQSYFALAAAKAGNETAVMESMAAVYRPAALWLTNKENFVAGNGDFAGTQINSSNMLWSLSGSLALVHKILFGISFTAHGLAFHPFVPEALKGDRTLKNFKYREAVLDVELSGYGNAIASFTVDGQPASPMIDKGLKGRHVIRIQLANGPTGGKVAMKEESVSPATPVLSYANGRIKWDAVAGTAQYIVLKNGGVLMKSGATEVKIDSTGFGEYQVIAVDANGVQSFASEPVLIAGKAVILVQAENGAGASPLPYKGFTGKGFAETSKTKNTSLHFTVTVPQDGFYSVDVRYANGSGPVNTENKCAIRTLKEGANFIGTVVLPQRGREEWSNWGWSNPVRTALKKGSHTFTLSLEPYNENMNGEINEAMLDCIRIIYTGKAEQK